MIQADQMIKSDRSRARIPEHLSHLLQNDRAIPYLRFCSPAGCRQSTLSGDGPQRGSVALRACWRPCGPRPRQGLPDAKHGSAGTRAKWLATRAQWPQHAACRRAKDIMISSVGCQLTSFALLWRSGTARAVAFRVAAPRLGGEAITDVSAPRLGQTWPPLPHLQQAQSYCNQKPSSIAFAPVFLAARGA